MKPINIAIDGPSGAGKSTLARRIAAKLGYVYVDTGAMYRAIAYYMHTKNADSTADIIAQLPNLTVSLSYGEDGVQHVYANGEDVSDKIRTPEMSMGASKVSAIPEVREFLLDTQRSLAKQTSVVMDGRDIGTVVLPDAQVKIYLTVSAETRAYRRFLELQEKQPDSAPSYEEVLADVIQRDHQDMTREIAPLKQAEDAVLADTGELDLDQSEALLLQICKERLQT
ncbi:MAG: (d)CMP kinase [Oscillospiraceae bacterium]|nr:(d)CMP kinase [Oscillospiraceae bacterium]